MKFYLKTDKENTQLKIKLYYHLGGMNYFTSKVEKRGYYLSVTPVEIERKDNNISFEVYKAFSGYKALVLETKRKSDKAYNTAAQMIENKKQELIQIICSTNNLQVI